jgi:Plasmid pRiA4b ORF-3-like protein
MDDIIQLKISLQGTDPVIWRRVLVSKKTTFFELHHIIQIAMGWENYHLFEFNVYDYRIGMPDEEFDYYSNSKMVDASSVTLDSIITETKEEFVYEYDFGDGWRHQIVVEEFLSDNATESYTVCIDGEMNCPPEDCGGVGGFYYMIKAIKDKKHPEHEQMSEWLGYHYDPLLFDKELINAHLILLEEYIKELKNYK